MGREDGSMKAIDVRRAGEYVKCGQLIEVVDGPGGVACGVVLLGSGELRRIALSELRAVRQSQEVKA